MNQSSSTSIHATNANKVKKNAVGAVHVMHSLRELRNPGILMDWIRGLRSPESWTPASDTDDNRSTKVFDPISLPFSALFESFGASKSVVLAGAQNDYTQQGYSCGN